MKIILSAVIIISTLLFSAVFAAPDRWTPPAMQTAPAQLPKLARPMKMDGVLTEWESAACVPLYCRSYILYSRDPHKWNGPADAGFEVYCAWNDKGLCLAAVVADDDVRNNRPSKDYWQQDCVEFFLDGRVGEKFMQPPYSRGAYQILIRPPIGNQLPKAAINPRDGAISGLQIAGKRAPTGYTIELFVPWSAFPGFLPKAGSRFAFSFAMDDYDKRDGNLVQPLVISYRATDNLWQYPQNFIMWELMDTLKTGAEIDLGPQVALDVPALFVDDKPIIISLEAGGTLAKRAASVLVTAADGLGKKVFEQNVKTFSLLTPWQSAKAAKVEFPLSAKTDGYYVISATIKDELGNPLGTAARPCLCIGNTLQGALKLVRVTNLRQISQTEPFKALQYLGLGARIEQVKRWVEKRNIPQIIRETRDLEARLDLLQDGKLDRSDYGIYDLIILTAEPDSQVVVEYPSSTEAIVTFYCGSIPIACARVSNDAVDALTSIGPVAEKVKALVSARKPIKFADADAVRQALVEALAPKTVLLDVPAGLDLYCGDLHVHSFYSDGANSPIGMALQAMYCYMDFMALTDHNRIDGAQLGQKLFSQYGFAFPYIVGEEITTNWSHFNAYPLKEVISSELPLYEIVKAAHVQGAVIQWNHPEAVKSEWANSQVPKGLADTALDAWEHIPSAYDEWKRAGKLPVLTGTTDTHDGTFSSFERTVVLAPTAEGDDIAEAIRYGRAVVVNRNGPYFLYGYDEMTSLVWSALAEGQELRKVKANRIRKALANANLSGIIAASRSKWW
jgi:hypothetical protein